MKRFHIDRGYQSRTQGRAFIVVLLLPIAVLLTLFFSATMWYQSQLQPVDSTDTSEVAIHIPTGSSTNEIGQLLEAKELIRSARAFGWYVRLQAPGGGLQAGMYEFSASQSTQEIAAKIIEGAVTTDYVTILPAQRLDQVKEAFLQVGYTPDEIAAGFAADQYRDHPALESLPPGANLEGYLYPETFQRSEDTTISEIIRLSLDEMAEVLSPALQAKFTEQGLTVREAIILASIVEREVSNPEERPIVAQVFLSRYSRNIALGSDPTALYGALIAGIEPSVRADTPYNTRLYPGLPPGPINNVSLNSLEAVANPADTDYLFFVSGDDGKTYFSRTQAEHEALTAEHCVELCRSY